MCMDQFNPSEKFKQWFAELEKTKVDEVAGVSGKFTNQGGLAYVLFGIANGVYQKLDPAYFTEANYEEFLRLQLNPTIQILEVAGLSKEMINDAIKLGSEWANEGYQNKEREKA
jgi:hypothetical protein